MDFALHNHEPVLWSSTLSATPRTPAVAAAPDMSLMSANGTKRTSASALHMSAFGGNITLTNPRTNAKRFLIQIKKLSGGVTIGTGQSD